MADEDTKVGLGGLTKDEGEPVTDVATTTQIPRGTVNCDGNREIRAMTMVGMPCPPLPIMASR
jgi:hypothetical protein